MAPLQIRYPTGSIFDLKNGKLTHRDVGQMDGYVRLFEDRFKTPGDNPTIGLILCSDKSEALAKYTVLSESRQIFASKYLQFLQSEEELRLEIRGSVGKSKRPWRKRSGTKRRSAPGLVMRRSKQGFPLMVDTIPTMRKHQ